MTTTPSSGRPRLLSPHFALYELLVTSHPELQASPGREELAYLTRLCLELLEVIRLEVGPLHVSSGYRTPALNKRIGGSPTTCHVFGGAADVEPLLPGWTPRRAMQVVGRLHREGKLPALDQAILYDADTSAGSFLHVALPRSGKKPRGQLMQTPGDGGAAGPYTEWAP